MRCDNDLWIGTENGLVWFNRKKEGGVNGFNKFDAQAIKMNDEPP